MLREFFKYYGEAPLDSQGPSVVSGSLQEKLGEHAGEALYLPNPLEPHLNAARTVQPQHVAHFQQACRLGIPTLGHTHTKNTHTSGRPSGGMI